jgi:hypothetical protein
VRKVAFFGLIMVVAAGSAAADDGFAAGPAPEAQVIVGEPEPTYGTASLTAFTVPSSSFTARQSTNAYTTGSGIERFLPGGGFMDAGVMLPNGSQVERLELRACDTDAATQVRADLGVCNTPGAVCTIAAGVATGTTATPGCTNFSVTLAAPLIVNNQAAPIIVEVATGTTATTTFSAVKVYYRLRISPAPATATFPVDVPTTHPFFRFVEALAAAGISGGCGPSAFCPDQPVTRGQMSVFLATALGLHFPN